MLGATAVDGPSSTARSVARPPPDSIQGPCKVSFARPDLRLWRPAAQSDLLNHGCAVYLHGERSAFVQVGAIWWSVWRREGPESTPDRSLWRQHVCRSRRC